jgi:hypothetical protein
MMSPSSLAVIVPVGRGVSGEDGSMVLDWKEICCLRIASR